MANSIMVDGLPTRRPRLLYGETQSAGSPGMVIGSSTTVVGNDANTNEKTAWTFSLPANALSVDGDRLRITVRFNAAANANAKRFRIYFGGTGGTAVWDSSAVAYNASTFLVTVILTRLTATTQRASSTGGSATGGTPVNITLSSTPAQTLTNAIDIVATVQSTAAGTANDALFSDGMVEVLPVNF
jgi:hypothetical protein